MNTDRVQGVCQDMVKKEVIFVVLIVKIYYSVSCGVVGSAFFPSTVSPLSGSFSNNINRSKNALSRE